ncbi:zinc-binding alcohol dehydrogenase [Kribbella capetownensis]|uniref:Zinc-binding alcohol dehydrogenase n=1 Tax=Kribbella capetownensis TaxID=1572659 RepID=A0A4R0JKV0_9ACTN|nr:zinc-binding alcohol dehydrogenase [Kribbella capetownensis]TCC47773.1 zinc-binding alcohol dehydrogenase [Kribbella capetownensis]
MTADNAIVFPGPGVAELCQVQLADTGPGEVRLRTRLSLMSTGTEGIAFARRFGEGTHWAQYVEYPFRPGYSVVGVVDQIGHESGLSVGDRVVARAPHASRVVVRADRCTPVPAGLADEQAVWFALAKIAFVGIRVGEVRPGSRVLVVGAGPIGQMATRWAAAAAAARIVVVDSVAARLDLATAGGATATIGSPIDDAQEELAGAFGGQPPEVVLDSTGNAAVLPGALRAAADHGRVVLLGDAGTPSDQRLTSDVMVRGVSIMGAHDSYTIGDQRWDNDREIARLVFRLAAAGRFPLAGLVGDRFGPEDCQQAYELAATQRHRTMGIVFDWD